MLTSHNVLEEVEVEASSIASSANQSPKNQFDLEFEQCMSTIEAHATVVPIDRADGQWAVENIIGERLRETGFIIKTTFYSPIVFKLTQC